MLTRDVEERKLVKREVREREKSLGGPNQGPAGSQSERPRTWQLVRMLALSYPVLSGPARQGIRHAGCGMSRLEVGIRKPTGGILRADATTWKANAPTQTRKKICEQHGNELAIGCSFYKRVRFCVADVRDSKNGRRTVEANN